MTTPTTWASCLWCPFTYDDTQPTRLRDHLDSHIRALRNELQVAATRHREMSEQLRTAGGIARRFVDVWAWCSRCGGVGVGPDRSQPPA